MNKSASAVPLTKADLLSIVTPLFDETKTETRRLVVLMEQMGSKIDTETRGLGILMEQMNSKIDTALETAILATEHEIEMKSLSKRIDEVETDVHVLKTAIISLAK